jgi:hypothetical protein
VSHRLRKLATTLILTAVLACPVLEMFDRWDDTARTGNDTETAIVVIVLCAGAALVPEATPHVTAPFPILIASHDICLD